MLRGRANECAALDELLRAAREGESRTLVLRGEAGIGKTALVEYAAARSEGCRVLRIVGIESEMELPFAAVHQLSMPLLDGFARLPPPQRDALATAFGFSSGPPPNRFFVGLALLSLLSDHAEVQPLVCLVDDAQWLDRSSAQVLSFVARRLRAESVVILFAERDAKGPGEVAGLPEMRLQGLSEADATELVASVTLEPLDEPVRDRIIAEAHGNPLALLELPRGRSANLAGGFAAPDGSPLPSQIEASFRRRVRQLPEDTQQLLLVAAAEPLGDPALLWRAVGELAIPIEAVAPAEADDLIEIGAQVIFRHALLRSAVYRAASPAERRRAHRVLATATDPEVDPDRRAWHRAQAALAPDEEIAAELELSAGRAQERGGLAATAAFLERAAELTPDRTRRAERALAAAPASLQAGAFDAALQLVAMAEAGPLDAFQSARADLVRSHVAFASGLGGSAPPLLLNAARCLESFDLELARETYLIAWGAAVFAGEGHLVLEICRSVRALPGPQGAPRPFDLLLDGLALLTTDGRAAAVPTLQRAAKALADISVEDAVRWGWVAPAASTAVWDDKGSLAISARLVQLVRDAGALVELPIHLSALGVARAWIGDFADAALLIAEADSVAAATGSPIAPYAALRFAALRGREAEASTLIASAIERAATGGQGMAARQAHWAAAVLYNGLARYEEAASAARKVATNTFEPWISMWALPELVESAARSGDAELARDALERLADTTQPAGTDFGLGIEARSRALLTEGEAAEGLYREAIDRLGRTRLRPDLARAHLLYGEWLRREGRRLDARDQLHTAYGMLAATGMEAFAERARRELAATGLKVRKRSDETRGQLTPQEAQIARLAAEGQTNPEIGAHLFLSPRTVEWHLRQVFTKVGLSSRRQLRDALSPTGSRG